MSQEAAILTAVATGTGDAQGLAAEAGRRLIGWSVSETAGTPAAATVILRHGTTTSDPPIAWIELTANGTQTVIVGERGLHVPNGVFVDRVAGETALGLYSVSGE